METELNTNVTTYNSAVDYQSSAEQVNPEDEEVEPPLELTRSEILECASLFSYYYRRDSKFPTYVTIARGSENIVVNRSQFIHYQGFYKHR